MSLSDSALNAVPKLLGAINFDAWYSGFRAASKLNRTWRILNQEVARPTPPITTNGKTDLTRQDAYEIRLNNYLDALTTADGALEYTCDNGAFKLVEEIDSPIKKLAQLKAMFGKKGYDSPIKKLGQLKAMSEKKGYTRRTILIRQITRSELSDFVSVTAYGQHIKRAYRQLIELKVKDFPMWIATTCLLYGLGEAYEEFVDRVLNTRDKDANGNPKEPDFDEILAQLIESGKLGREIKTF